ncbi:MAG: hypothetical protein HC886_06935 [Leptolyngbyaceae cyanobacterium SM1_1_3]|nr:hypothetical protein [Leptolyngbyaceae cyanobacterium SM1_1_3]NJN01173.1 hypothetical protein [Leptolyngbyaceae cyanobacterium RM1_1_2]NJO09248.1 hypothetical protein [Leptolyngbyaceae cyanobacterium SL_1_1]
MYWQQACSPIGLALLLTVSGGIWLGQTAIAPQAAQAYTSRTSLFLVRGENEGYETLIRRGDITARAAAQRSFDADLLATEVIVTVTAESQGIALPIMMLQVSRRQWSDRPDPRYWATYYPNARVLLFSESAL